MVVESVEEVGALVGVEDWVRAGDEALVEEAGAVDRGSDAEAEGSGVDVEAESEGRESLVDDGARLEGIASL